MPLGDETPSVGRGGNGMNLSFFAFTAKTPFPTFQRSRSRMKAKGRKEGRASDREDDIVEGKDLATMSLRRIDSAEGSWWVDWLLP